MARGLRGYVDAHPGRRKEADAVTLGIQAEELQPCRPANIRPSMPPNIQ
jgi:hypothetical protein